MAGICCGLVGEGETSAPIEPTSRTLKRRKMELMPSFKFMADVAVPSPVELSRKRRKLDLCSESSSSLSLQKDCDGRVESYEADGAKSNEDVRLNHAENLCEKSTPEQVDCPKFGVTSVCGRRRDMEDAASIHPCFSQHKEGSTASNGNLHFYGVFDGHGCSHVNPRNQNSNSKSFFTPSESLQSCSLTSNFV